MIDFDELERLCREATPGPWDVLDLTEESIEILSLASTVDPQCVVARIANVVSERPIGADDRANAKLIAALRNAAPELIAMARRWQALDTMMRSGPDAHLKVNGAGWPIFVAALDGCDMQEQER